MPGGVGDPGRRGGPVAVGGQHAELIAGEGAQVGLSVPQGGGGAKLAETQTQEEDGDGHDEDDGGDDYDNNNNRGNL